MPQHHTHENVQQPTWHIIACEQCIAACRTHCSAVASTATTLPWRHHACQCLAPLAFDVLPATWLLMYCLQRGVRCTACHMCLGRAVQCASQIIVCVNSSCCILALQQYLPLPSYPCVFQQRRLPLTIAHTHRSGPIQDHFYGDIRRMRALRMALSAARLE